MNYKNFSLQELFDIRHNMILEGKNTDDVSAWINFKEDEYINSILEDTSGTGGPAGAAGAATTGIGGGGVAYGNAAYGGMGAVVSSQPSNSAGVTTDPGYTLTGGKIGSGDVAVPYNTGGTKVFQKVPVDNRKGNSKRRKNKMLAQLKGALLKRQDFTAGQGQSKPKKLMNFDSFSKGELNKVTKVDQ